MIVSRRHQRRELSVAIQAVLPDSVVRGGDFCFELTVTNVGYAAPVRNRDVQLVLRDGA